MAIGFNIQFRINEKTQSRVIRLTDTSTGFTLSKGNFSIVFPDGSAINHTDFLSPDISTAGGYYEYQAPTDIYNNVLTGAYSVTFVAIDSTSTTHNLLRSFDFNWAKPTNGIVNKSDVLIPEVKFEDTTSYSPIGSFSGTLSRTLACSFPTTSEASAVAPISTVSSSVIDIISSGKYYDGTYSPTADIAITYSHSTNTWLSVYYVELFTKTYLIKRCPTQVELVVKINNYRALIDAYKEKNDTQFNTLSEQYDLVIALYSHLITRYETSTQDGSEPVLRELLSILEPYATSYTPQLTRMLPFEIASTGTNSFSISDGTNTDSIPLGSTLLLSSGNPAFTINVANNIVTYTPTFGSTSNTFAQGNDTRFHNAVTIGTANGLSLASQVLSLALATTSTSGAFSASDKAKLDGIAAGANTGTVTSVAISVPSAFAVSNSPVTTSGTINISATGSPLQYITGAGALSTFLTDVRAGISLTTTGTSGASTYNSTTGVLNIPQYQSVLTNPVTGTGTTNYVPKFTAVTTLGNSNIQDSGSLITLGSNTNINGFISGSAGKVLPTGNTFAGQTFNITGSADGWSLVNRNSWNINDDTFTTNGFTIYDNRLIITRSSTASIGWVNHQSIVQNNGTAAQSATGNISTSQGTGNFNSFIGYRVGASGNPANTNSYTEYVGFKMQYTPQNVTNYYGVSIADFTGTTLSRGVELNLASGTGKFNIYAQGTASNYLAGSLGIGTTALTAINVNVGKTITGGTVANGISQSGAVQSDVTSVVNSFNSVATTQASAFTLANYYHYNTFQSTIGAGSAITNQYGFAVNSNLTGATNNYGFYGNISSGTGRWNLYMTGTAQNYLAGDTGIGTTTLGTSTALTIGGTETAASAIARGQLVNTTLVASANNDVLVGLDITPTFTNGAFTGVSNVALRVNGNINTTSAGASSIGTGSVPFGNGIFNNIVYAATFQGYSGGFNFSVSGTNMGRFNATTGNLVLQNGGTYTDIASSRLTINSTTQGFLPPRMTATQRAAIASPADGLIVFQTDGTIGLYVYASAAWHALTML